MALLKNYLKDKNVASIARTSKSSVKKLCKRIDFSKDNLIIEYGAGCGAFTHYLLKHMNMRSKLIAIEKNKNLADMLSSIKDPRLIVVNECAGNIKQIAGRFNLEGADYVISGIPFSYLDKDAKNGIIKDTRSILSDSGKFLVYQLNPGVKKFLKNYFSVVNADFSPLNLPPLFIFEAHAEIAKPL
jgi:phospholipid N-methyltransferase